VYQAQQLNESLEHRLVAGHVAVYLSSADDGKQYTSYLSYGPGPLTCWPTWNGGELIIILCVLTNHSEWRSCSHEREVTGWWSNAIGNGLRLWQPGEPADDGRHRKCCVIPSRPYHPQPFESHSSEKTPRELAVGGSVKMKADRGGKLQDEVTSLEGQMRGKAARNAFAGAGRIVHHIPWQYPLHSLSTSHILG
jgi:hypothetical protein